MENTTFDIMSVAKQVESRVRRKRAARVLGGIGVATAGLMRGGVLAPLLVLSGALLCVRGATNKPLKETWRQVERWFSKGHTHRFGEGKRDLVDEASWQSFPASDPPALGGPVAIR